MKRLVIIGNGFDLAHGLPTSYTHFINDYWERACDTNGSKKINYKDNFVDITCKLGGVYNTIAHKAIDNINSYKELNNFVERNKADISGDSAIGFKNLFFKKICENSIENWVDIENEYYRDLKRIVKLASLSIKEKKRQTIILNQEFEDVKNLLEKYLNDKIIVNEETITPISDLFKLDRRTYDYYLEFPSQDHEALEKFQNEYNMDLEIGKNITTYYLNFNYTKTIDRYLNYAKEYRQNRFFGIVESIQIHGRLNDSSNKINFGFGDEMDDDYKIIENLDDNEYLRNFKSFQYLQNSNYKQLLDFVESDQKFQVYIMGHSCGLSDRTMLNTIFEHPNCRSIKVFYHQREDGSDNYTEITQNISRHFNKKKLMREKIVNKTLCQPLPQIQLPLK